MMIYQPHRYSRTRDLYEDFVQVLQRRTSCCCWTYAGGEDPSRGGQSSPVPGIRQRGQIGPVLSSISTMAPEVLCHR